MKLTHDEFLRLSRDDQESYRELHGESFEEHAPKPISKEENSPPIESQRTSFLSWMIRLVVLFGVIALIFWHNQNVQQVAETSKVSDHDQGRIDAEEFLRLSQMGDLRDLDFKNLKSDVALAETNEFAAQALPGDIKNFYNQLTSDEADFSSDEMSQLSMARNENKSAEYIDAMRDVFETAKAKLIAHDADMRAELPPISQ